jgi:phenylpyruvate tautomerase PptA (4-oxalocrotonate tautomerase family)
VPIYTCTTTESTLSAQTKKALAGEIGTIRSEINHVPSTHVNVVFHELPAERVLVVFESSPASFAVEGGRVLPEAGEEAAWIAGS